MELTVPTFVAAWLFLLAHAGAVFWLTLRYPASSGSEEAENGSLFELARNRRMDRYDWKLMVVMTIVICVVFFIILFTIKDAALIFFAFASCFMTLMFLGRIGAEKMLGEGKLGTYLVLGSLSLLIGSAWLTVPSWFSMNVAFVILGYSFASAWGSVRFRYILIASGVLIVYDFLGVIVLGLIPKLVESDFGLLPGMVQVPLNPFSLSSPVLISLGAGDVMFPALIMRVAARYKLAVPTFLAFGLGLALAFLAVYVFDRGIPAMVPILPCMLVALCGGYIWKYRKGELDRPLSAAAWNE